MSILYSALTIVTVIGMIALGIALLPEANGLPTGIQDAIYTTVGWIKAFSLLIDFNTLFVVFGIIIGTELIILSIKALFWIYRLFLKGGTS